MTVAPERPVRVPSVSVDLYGLRLDVRVGDEAVRGAIAARLAEFPSARASAADLTFAVEAAPAAAPHTVGPPAAAARTVYESQAGRVRYDEERDVLSIVHREGVRLACAVGAGQVDVSVRGDRPPSPWLLSRPLLSLPLLELLKRRGRFGLHAAGVERNGAAVLAAGPAGAGKSTLALTLARAGFGLLGDDLVFLTDHDGRLRVLPFADEIELGEEALVLFPELAPSAGPPPPGWPKQRLAPRALGLPLGRPAEPAVLLLPVRIAGTRSRVRPISRNDALLELLPNVILTDRRSCEAHVDALAELVRVADCYRLESGRDLAALAALVADVAGR